MTERSGVDEVARCYFYFSTACSSVFVNTSRLNLILFTKLVAVAMNKQCITHFIDTESNSCFTKFTSKKWIVQMV